MKRALLVLAACGAPAEPRALENTVRGPAMSKTQQLIASLRSATIRVATMRPPGATTAVLERRVMIVGPDAAKQLAERGDLAVLDELLPLLDDRERAWAAHVLLAKLTRYDEKIVDTFMTEPDEWWKAFGAHARRRWTEWLAEHRGKLAWDPKAGAFVPR